jgi:alpha-D-ribose 1-methylphosphonate 5-triphosphate diphosphatase
MQTLYNAKVVTPDAVIDGGSVTIEQGSISEVTHSAGVRAGVDLEGRYLLPGLIDLHCDAIEKVLEPRPGVMMPIDYAIDAADRLSVAAGILTPFHSITFSEGELGVRDPRLAASLVREVVAREGRTLADARVHCRYEITDTTSHRLLAELIQDGMVDLLSFMDHTPGQGQFHDIEAYTAFLQKNYHYEPERIRAILEHKQEARESAAERVGELAALARAHGIPIAGHDDDSPERIRLMHELGARISEFPINEATARAARQLGLGTVYGAPNLVRGQSQSGNMKALDAVRAGVCDCLCADYVPAAMLVAVFRLLEWTDFTLPEAVALVSRNPARYAGLSDRGSIAVGARADLIAVEVVRGVPQVTTAWLAGRRIFSAEYPPQARVSTKARRDRPAAAPGEP